MPSLCMSQTTINKQLIFDGIDREYIVYIPESYDGQKEYPLMFNFSWRKRDYANYFIFTKMT